MRRVACAYRAAGVTSIELAHGTFVGSDALGALAGVARIAPGAADALRQVSRDVVHALVGEAGNFTPHYAELLESSLTLPTEPPLPVRLFDWSSENHHLGRADGAVRLIDLLAATAHELPPGARVLLWGHSHAGNVFALATNLLGGDHETVERFFAATRVWYRWPLLGWVDVPLWERVRRILLDDRQRLRDLELDIVTFGTPVRYGWDSDGYAQLLHFVHHRPAADRPSYQAPFPPRWENVLAAADGDYIQQLGIAGTDALPSVFSWRAWCADQRLRALLEQNVGREGLISRLSAGVRVAQEGTTLLVDYGPPEGNLAAHHAGHSIYTREHWLLFHAEEVARQFYGLDVA